MYLAIQYPLERMDEPYEGTHLTLAERQRLVCDITMGRGAQIPIYADWRRTTILGHVTCACINAEGEVYFGGTGLDDGEGKEFAAITRLWDNGRGGILARRIEGVIYIHKDQIGRW